MGERPIGKRFAAGEAADRSRRLVRPLGRGLNGSEWAEPPLSSALAGLERGGFLVGGQTGAGLRLADVEAAGGGARFGAWA